MREHRMEAGSMRYPLCRSVLVLAALALADACPEAADWPMYRADAARTGYSSEPLPENLELRWIYRNRMGAAPAWPSSSRITFDSACQPILVGPLVIFGSSAQDKIVALDTDSGTIRWTFCTGGPVRFTGRQAWGLPDNYYCRPRDDLSVCSCLFCSVIASRLSRSANTRGVMKRRRFVF